MMLCSQLKEKNLFLDENILLGAHKERKILYYFSVFTFSI